MKSRNQKRYEYTNKYSHIPNTKEEIIEYIKDNYKIDENVSVHQKDIMTNIIKIVLFEVPEGAKRPRATILNRNNISKMAIKNSSMIHIYSPNAKEDQAHMKRLVNNQIIEIDKLINTPCEIIIDAYLKTPSKFNKREILLAEEGIIRPITYPDWDNIAKKYCDMFNHNVWIDDKYCVSGTVNKYYSIKPRVEITLKYADMIYIKKQKTVEGDDLECLII